MDFTERRKFKRLNVNFIVTFQVNRPPEIRMSIGGMDIDALMMDLSEGGMAITTDYEIPSGTLLYIYFTLINPFRNEDDRVTKMELLGEVRSCSILDNHKQRRLGICFTQMKEDDKKAVADFVKLNTEQKHP
ncbi:MAG: PilZ domain-containing protein [Candidatus Omnitrophica bacterium]|nr:PilZ domain-containing protein [Candidatus Omnitrophota bacterium]